jgi:hypothetical protein
MTEPGDNFPDGSMIKNISKGGAMVVTSRDVEVGAAVKLKVKFDSGNVFTSLARVLRKQPKENGVYSYGVQFINMSAEDSVIINQELSAYEKEILKSLTLFRKYKRKNLENFSTKISILSYDAEGSYEIREGLIKLGAENCETKTEIIDLSSEKAVKRLSRSTNDSSQPLTIKVGDYDLERSMISVFVSQFSAQSIRYSCPVTQTSPS